MRLHFYHVSNGLYPEMDALFARIWVQGVYGPFKPLSDINTESRTRAVCHFGLVNFIQAEVSRIRSPVVTNNEVAMHIRSENVRKELPSVTHFESSISRSSVSFGRDNVLYRHA